MGKEFTVRDWWLSEVWVWFFMVRVGGMDTEGQRGELNCSRQQDGKCGLEAPTSFRSGMKSPDQRVTSCWHSENLIVSACLAVGMLSGRRIY